MFLALLLLALSLQVVGCPRWLTEAWVMNRGGGGGTTQPHCSPPVTPGARYIGDGSSSSLGNPTLGTAPGTAPLARQKGVYTPTAHEGP